MIITEITVIRNSYIHVAYLVTLDGLSYLTISWGNHADYLRVVEHINFLKFR